MLEARGHDNRVIARVDWPSPPGVIPPRRDSRYRATFKRPIASVDESWRRGWDSNPRIPVKILLEFQSSAFDRSATSPINPLRDLSRRRLRRGVRRIEPTKKGGE